MHLTIAANPWVAYVKYKALGQREFWKNGIEIVLRFICFALS